MSIVKGVLRIAGGAVVSVAAARALDEVIDRYKMARKRVHERRNCSPENPCFQKRCPKCASFEDVSGSGG